MVFGKVAENLESAAIAAVSLSLLSIGGTPSSMARSLPIIGGTAGQLVRLANLGLVGVALNWCWLSGVKSTSKRQEVRFIQRSRR